MKGKNIFMLMIICVFTSCNENNKTLVLRNTSNSIKQVSTQHQGFCTQLLPDDLESHAFFATELELVQTYAMEKSNYLNSTSLTNFKANFELEVENYKGDSLTFLNRKAIEFNIKGIQSVILDENIWSDNVIKVRFLDDPYNLKEKVRNIAKEWEFECPVELDFSPVGKSDITITFNDNGYWSYIGTDSRNHIPSMSLSGIHNENEADFAGTVLHEFGHALGLLHEHQSPNANILWNEPEVYNYYKKTQGWDDETIYENIIYAYNFGQYNGEDATEFDPESIMLYHIPPSLLDPNENRVFNRNNLLSDLDIELVTKKYQ